MVATIFNVSLAPLCSFDIKNTSRHDLSHLSSILAKKNSFTSAYVCETLDDLREEYYDNHK